MEKNILHCNCVKHYRLENILWKTQLLKNLLQHLLLFFINRSCCSISLNANPVTMVSTRCTPLMSLHASPNARKWKFDYFYIHNTYFSNLATKCVYNIQQCLEIGRTVRSNMSLRSVKLERRRFNHVFRTTIILALMFTVYKWIEQCDQT